LTRDPAKDGRNWSAYCSNDPLRRTDPTGEVAPLLVIGFIVIALILAHETAEAPTKDETHEDFERHRSENGAAKAESIRKVVEVVLAAGGGGRSSSDDGVVLIGEGGGNSDSTKKAVLNMERGKLMHQQVQQEFRAKDSDWIPEKRLDSGDRPDLYHPKERKIIEIKPNNPRGIWEGKAQLRRYLKQLPEGWSGELYLY
jgi:hypothetical protein